MTQNTIEGVLPDRDETLERLVQERLKHKAALQKLADKLTTNYDAIKERMRERELEEYKCYDRRHKVLLEQKDASVKLKEVKETEASPYRPAAAQPVDDSDAPDD